MKEVASDVDAYRGDCTVLDKLSKLGTVATTDIEHRPSGDIA